jgi:predicted DNA repair protein MutK
VVWEVAKGSLVNKLILVPVALALSALAPWSITPLLMGGGLYLCYEGCEKLAHSLLQSKSSEAAEQSELLHQLADPDADLVAFERNKIRGAVRTDLILSAEIIVIALGTVQNAPLATRAAVVASIALGLTVGVYALVAAIVKLDDLGLYLLKSAHRPVQLLGSALLRLAPLLMKCLSVAGTAAMFLVGGGIILHGLPFHSLPGTLAARLISFPGGWSFLAALVPSLFAAATGIIAGAIALATVQLADRLRLRFTR